MKVILVLLSLIGVACSDRTEAARQEGYNRGQAEALDCVRGQGGDARSAADACDE